MIVREFFPDRWLIAENIESYFLFYVNKTNIFATRKILFHAENSFLKTTLKVAHLI